ncbi:MAG: hypothetical protein JWM77_192 [Rhodospirillales bacterium]|nr:hypothetical protein [Rhodospirillales bacterium]
MTLRNLAFTLLFAAAATPAAAGQITIVNDGAQEIGFQIFDGKTYVDSGRVRPPAGTSTARNVPDKKITLVLWRGGGSNGKYDDKDRCQVDLAKGTGIVHVTGGDKLTCKLAKK